MDVRKKYNSGREEKLWRSGRKVMDIGKKNNGATDLGRGNNDEKRAARTG